MAKLNWRDVNDELPEAENHLLMYSKYCLVVIIRENGVKAIKRDFYCTACQHWGDHMNMQVTHWIYEDELLQTL